MTDHTTDDTATPTLPDTARRLASYIAQARDTELPADAWECTQLHLIDSIAAVAAGSTLDGGLAAARFAEVEPSTGRSTVIGSKSTRGAVLAAFANGMSGHADEMDDHHQFSVTHPGCAIVPAALAVAEREGSTGTALLRAVALGYDVCTRVATSLGEPSRDPRNGTVPTLPLGAAFGCAAAAASLMEFDEAQTATLLTYMSQQASGVWSFLRDSSHVSKSFALAGRPARDGVTGADLVRSGFTGEPDALLGSPGFLSTYATEPDADTLVVGLGTEYEILRTNLKMYPVGGPLQAVVQALVMLMRETPVDPDEIAHVDISMNARDAFIVKDRPMVNINASYIAAATILDGLITFQAAHDYERRNRPEVAGLMERIELHGDDTLTRLPRQARVVLTMRDGEVHEKFLSGVRGTSYDPMERDEVEAKFVQTLTLVSGAALTEELRACLGQLPEMSDLGELSRLLQRV